MPRDYPARPVVGIGVVVLRGNDVLLIRRRSPPRAHRWSLPGGVQELGETVFAAARREVFEETAVEIAVDGLIDVVDLIEHDDRDGRIRWHYTLIEVRASWRAGEVLAGSDAEAAVWVALDRLDGLGLWEETRRIIGRAQVLRAASSAG